MSNPSPSPPPSLSPSPSVLPVNQTNVTHDLYSVLRISNHWDVFGIVFTLLAAAVFLSWLYVTIAYIRIVRRYQVIEEEEKLVDMYYRFKAMKRTAPQTQTSVQPGTQTTQGGLGGLG